MCAIVISFGCNNYKQMKLCLYPVIVSSRSMDITIHQTSRVLDLGYILFLTVVKDITEVGRLLRILSVVLAMDVGTLSHKYHVHIHNYSKHPFTLKWLRHNA